MKVITPGCIHEQSAGPTERREHVTKIFFFPSTNFIIEENTRIFLPIRASSFYADQVVILRDCVSIFLGLPRSLSLRLTIQFWHFNNIPAELRIPIQILRRLRYYFSNNSPLSTTVLNTQLRLPSRFTLPAATLPPLRLLRPLSCIPYPRPRCSRKQNLRKLGVKLATNFSPPSHR